MCTNVNGYNDNELPPPHTTTYHGTTIDNDGHKQPSLHTATDELDVKLERVTADLLRSSTGSITITKEDAIVLNGEGSKDSIQARVTDTGHTTQQVNDVNVVKCEPHAA
jgi:hypothetical protein